MDIPITVDLTDAKPCDLRCGLVHHRDTYCAAYPKCAAGIVHRVQAVFGRRHQVHEITYAETKRSALGGYSQTKILKFPGDGSTIEQVELHCRTLKFESLLRTQPVEAREPVDAPAGTPSTSAGEPRTPNKIGSVRN